MRRTPETGGVVLRPAAPSDIPGIQAVAVEAFSKYVERLGGQEPEPMRTDYAAILEQGGLHVAIVDGEVAGFFEFYLREDDVFLDKIAVAPRHQSSGVGQALYIIANVMVRESGVSYLRLYTNAAMTENIALYEAAGFVATERRTEKGYDRVYMERRVRKERHV